MFPINSDHNITDKKEEFETFDTKKHDINKRDNLCIRFIRKKFKCLVIFILLLITIFELCNTIISKIDETLLKTMIENFSNNFKTSLNII